MLREERGMRFAVGGMWRGLGEWEEGREKAIVFGSYCHEIDVFFRLLAVWSLYKERRFFHGEKGEGDERPAGIVLAVKLDGWGL